MNYDQNVQRITCKPAQPNPLFESWLQELYDEALQKNSKLVNMLKEALDSISKYPLPLRSGAECAILKGFGKKLCLFLDQKLEMYKNTANEPIEQSLSQEETDSESSDSVKSSRTTSPTSSSQSQQTTTTSSQSQLTTNSTNSQNTCSQSPKQKLPKKPRIYKPAYRSGGYAILIALLHHQDQNPDSGGLKKEDLIDKAQDYSEESFTRPRPESFYTAWSNMTRLISKGLVNKSRRNKPEFSLTEEGYNLALELIRDNKNRVSVNDMIFNDAPTRPVINDKDDTNDVKVLNVRQPSQNSVKLLDITLDFDPGTFNIILLIDKQETSGAGKKNDPTVAQFKKYPDLKHEYRHLKVGDFTWIAQHKTSKDQEIVLPYIVERKRMDDLGHSIKDGRFHEQKFRLRKCGIKNVIYLIENFGSNKHVGLPVLSLMQALANTRVQDKFKVHTTNSLGDTARFLAMMTKRLTIEYKNKCLKGRTTDPTGDEFMVFSYFNKSSAKSKPLTVTETFMKLLLQLKGLSVEKALAITNVYNTPKSLIDAYQDCDEKSGEMLLSILKYGETSRNVGPLVSKAVYQLFSNKDLN